LLKKLNLIQQSRNSSQRDTVNRKTLLHKISITKTKSGLAAYGSGTGISTVDMVKKNCLQTPDTPVFELKLFVGLDAAVM